MPMIIKSTGGNDFPQLDEGTHIAICDQIINLGLQEQEWQGEVSHKNQVFLRFVVPAERTTWKDKEDEEHEGPLTISAWLTQSLDDRANLRKYVEAWNSKALTQDEVEGGFDISQQLGKACQVSVSHSKTGKAKLTNIIALPKGMEAPELETEPLLYDPDEPDSWGRVPKGIQKICIKGGVGQGEAEYSDSESIPFAFLLPLVSTIAGAGYVAQTVLQV